ncbi:MarR family winged helix-turn-helix transcriptional regulator [Nocardioides bigeumensis]|uniref:MarR family transcriptional regulator n=1 Tax=Nocardioides bigeumensis TaxID=433657 RepID=A0ABP5JCF0_9ACTN
MTQTSGEPPTDAPTDAESIPRIGPVTRWLDEDQQRSWRALVMGTTLLMDRLDADLRASFRVSLTEYEILVRLSEQPGRRMRMAQLADAMCHSRSRVTHTVQRMEDAGYLERIMSPEDGRGILASMTDAGHTLLERAAHVHVSGVRANLVDLVSDDDFAALGRAMNSVADHLVSRHPAAEIR